MHGMLIITWRNGDPIAPAVVSGDDAGNDYDDDASPSPLPPNPLDLHVIDVNVVALLPVVPVDI